MPHPAPVINRLPQGRIASMPHERGAGLAALACDRGHAGVSPQGMVISAGEGLMGLGQHRGSDHGPDSRQRAEDQEELDLASAALQAGLGQRQRRLAQQGDERLGLDAPNAVAFERRREAGQQQVAQTGAESCRGDRPSNRGGREMGGAGAELPDGGRAVCHAQLADRLAASIEDANLVGLGSPVHANLKSERRFGQGSSLRKFAAAATLNHDPAKSGAPPTRKPPAAKRP